MSEQQSSTHGPSQDGSDTDGQQSTTDPVSEEAADLRQAIAGVLDPGTFPGDAAAVQAAAAEHGASDEVRRTLARLPEDHTYASVDDVLRAVDAP